MGIVIMLTMALGAVWLLRWPVKPTLIMGASDQITGAVLIILGLWNALWYGLRHMDAFFWGGMSILSGAVMILAGLALIGSWPPPRANRLLGAGLAVCAAVYLVGITRLQFV